jgi:uncharacterized protein (TIGR03085 family)
MTATDLRQRERAELLETLRSVGPDAPSLCAGWSAADIAAHLTISERAYGIPMYVTNGVRRVLPGAITRRGIVALESVGDRLVRRARRSNWDSLLRRLAGGPPRLYRSGSLGQLRLVEEFVHHEDVRRANGRAAREFDREFTEALWQAGLMLAHYPEFVLGRDGLEIERETGETVALGSDIRGRVVGSPGEILMYLAGRNAAAEVRVSGDETYLRNVRELTV